MHVIFAKVLVLTSIISLSAGKTTSDLQGNGILQQPREFPCPDTADIAPCVCTYDSDRVELTLDCTDITSNGELATILAKDFPSNKFHELRINSSMFLTNLNFSCGGVEFENFNLSPGPFPLVEVTNEFYLSCSSDNLESVKLDQTELTYLVFPPAPLKDGLYSFEMDKSNLAVIPLISSYDLDQLYLSSGLVSQIIPGTFDDIPKLRVLSLAGNKIKSLSSYSIPINGYSYDISNNGLESIEANAIYATGQLTYNTLAIYINDNLLTTIDASVFESLMVYIDFLDISGNPLDCGCDLAWIILDPANLFKVVKYASPTCADGTLLTDLDTALYEQLC